MAVCGSFFGRHRQLLSIISNIFNFKPTNFTSEEDMELKKRIEKFKTNEFEPNREFYLGL
jgi:hypothetical protein